VARKRHRLDAVHTFSRTIWAVSWPLLFVTASETVIHVTDTAFLGRVGTAELAAFALANTLFDAVIAPVIGLAEAMQIIIGRRVGERREDAVGPTFLRGMLLILVVSAILASVLHLGASLIGQTFGETPALADGMQRFLSTAAYGVVFFSLSLGYSALYVGFARTVILIAGTLVLIGTNSLLSYALILGRLGQARLGIDGAAWAFVIAELATFVFLTGYTAAKKVVGRTRTVAVRATTAVPIFGPLLRLSPPIALQALLEVLRWLGFFVIVEQVSEQALAWSNIIYACYLILLIPSDAVGEGTHSLVTNLIGQGRQAEVRRLTGRATRITFLITAPAAALALLAPERVIAWFTDNPAALTGAAPSLRVVAIIMVLAVPAEISLAAVAGTGATEAAFAVDLILSVALLTCAYLAAIPLALPLRYIWISLGVAVLVALVLSHRWLASKQVRRV
jgi:MATE family multidrug resistance protein